VHGEPLDSAGRPQQLIVVGMGKLGGGELNASSDIDLIFVFPEDGETDGRARKINNFEFFTRLGKRLINAIDDKTGDGYVFRVDMRLRPYGDSGPLVSSFAMLEDYFYTQAREWERYAWIKGRALTGAPERIEELEKLRKPFVFRKYLDFGAFGSMRELHAQIRREVAKQGQGRQHQARPRRHPRDRIHRPGIPADPRRPDRPALQVRGQRARCCISSPPMGLMPEHQSRRNSKPPTCSCATWNIACNISTMRRPRRCRKWRRRSPACRRGHGICRLGRASGPAESDAAQGLRPVRTGVRRAPGRPVGPSAGRLVRRAR
jgi:hypothetical protein